MSENKIVLSICNTIYASSFFYQSFDKLLNKTCHVVLHKTMCADLLARFEPILTPGILVSLRDNVCILALALVFGSYGIGKIYLFHRPPLCAKNRI